MSLAALEAQAKGSPADLRVRAALASTTFAEEEIEQSVVSRFEKQVARHSARIAVKGKSCQFTYDGLNRTANRIARALAAESQASIAPVALLFEHDAVAVAAMLGALKSGRAYVPLDVSYPPDRMNHILQDSGADVILADQRTLTRAQNLAQERCRALNVEAIDAAVSGADLDRLISPDAVAYILYTSGSTGEPKGVVQTHRNLLHFIRSYSNSLGIHDGDRLSCLPAFGFSASLMDIYGALLNGATVYPFDVKTEGNDRLADWLNEEQITIYHSVPTLFRHFSRSLNSHQRFPKLRLLDLGGEPVDTRDIELFRTHFARPCVLVNHMAFTEASVAAQFFIDHDSEIASGTVPAGYAADRIEISLTDENGREVGPGEIGEICVRSPHLSPGYWRKPELTSASFSASSGPNGARCYRTGDLGRLRPDGALEHLGRKDSRVKIRGFTVEVAEVEAALLKLDVVKDAVVVARDDERGEALLVAYVVPSGMSKPAGSELRRLLCEKLPDHMVPSAYVLMDALPLIPNGKVDRRALPAYDPRKFERDNVFVTPRTPVEEVMAGIWAEVLSVDELSVQDNFFDLGGHSLLAIQLIARLREAFQVDLPIRSLFESTTVAGLAEQIEALKRGDRGEKEVPWTSLVPIQAGGSRRPFFLIPGGLGSDEEFLVYARMARYLGREYPFYGLRARASDRKQQPHTCAEEMATDYLREIRAIQPRGPYLLVGECVGGIVAYEMAQQLLAQGQEVALLALLDTPRPTSVRQLKFSWRKLHERILGSEENLPRRIARHWREPAELGLRKRLEYFFGKSRKFAVEIASVSYLKKTPPNNDELKKIWHDEVLRSGYLRSLLRYRPKRYARRVTMLVNETDARGNPKPVWQRLAVGGLEIHTVPGDHFSYIRDHVKDVAEKLRDCLDKAMIQ
jgi:amino acid adenylation domain-containing protein